MVKKEDKTVQTKRLIYIGPTLRAYGIIQNTVYIGDIKTKFKDAIEKYPHITRLFVPLDKLGTARQNMAVRGTPENIAALEIRGEE